MKSLSTSLPTDRLKDIAAINGQSLSANTDLDYEFDYLEISNVNYFGVIDTNAIDRLRYEDAPSRARRKVPKNSTVISSVRPNLQAVAFFPEAGDDYICSTGFNVVLPHAQKLDPHFVYFVLISENTRQYFEAAAKGVGYPAVDDKDFNSLLIPLPPLPEQKRIADYLDASCRAIDAAVEAKRRQIEVLEALQKDIINQAVTFGIKPSTTLKRVDEEWLGQVPAHWDVCRIKRIVSRIDYGISQRTEEEGQFPVLKMGHIQNGEISLANLDFVDDVTEELLLEKGDILYNRTNSSDQVAKAAVFRGSKEDRVTFASYLVRLRTNHRANPYFFNYVVNCSGFLGFARKLAIPSVQQSNLNSTRYGRMLTPLPSLTEQQEIVGFLDQKTDEIMRVVDTIQSQISTLTAYRKSLIHECITGQRRITEQDLHNLQEQMTFDDK